MVLVDVAVPSYNHRRFLERTINSILDNSKTVPLHLWIVDDGSTDGSVEFLKTLNDDRVSVIFNEKNMGSCYAANRAIEMGSAPFVAVCNSDDSWSSDKLQKQLQSIENEPEKVSFTLVDYIDEEDNILPKGFGAYTENVFAVKPSWDRYDWLRLLSVGQNRLCATTFLSRRIIIEKSGLFDVRFRQMPDIDMWSRVFQYADPIVLPEKLASFRLMKDRSNVSAGGNNESESRSLVERYILVRKFYQNVPYEIFYKMFPSRYTSSNMMPFDVKIKTLAATKNSQLRLAALEMLSDNIDTKRECSALTHMDLQELAGRYTLKD